MTSPDNRFLGTGHGSAEPSPRSAEPNHRSAEPNHHSAEPNHRSAEPNHRSAEHNPRSAEPNLRFPELFEGPTDGRAASTGRPTLPATPLRSVPWPAVIAFTILSMALAWGVAIPLWLGEGLASPNLGVIAMLIMYTPAVAVLIVMFLMRKPRLDRLRFLGMWPLRPAGRTVGFTVAALFVPAILVAATTFLAAALGLVELDLVNFSGFAAVMGPALASTGVDPATIPMSALVASQLVAIPIGAILNSLLAFGEEIGWRGWLVPALRPLGVWPALLISGAIWGLWHSPLILLGYNFGRTDVVGVLLMVGGCVAWGVLFGWTRLRTGSVWPAVFGHGALNAAAGLLMLFIAAGQVPDMGIVGPLGVVSWVVLAVVVGILAVTGQFRREVLS